jgi:hypothetical protein
MPKKYTKRRKGGANIENLQIDFNELETIVEKINNDVKELKNQITNVSTNDKLEEEIIISEDLEEPKISEDLEEPQNLEKKTLDEKKTEILNLIDKVNKILYVDDNCNLKMKQKPCSTGKESIDGFQRALNKSDFDHNKADALKMNVENYIAKIKSDLGIKGGRKTKKNRKYKRRMTKRRK